ncbi:MAG: CotH kinase family protein, partial [Bacteroidia bacterium]|nr:CotH kinase family protein [Bacteroidia bacterium]
MGRCGWVFIFLALLPASVKAQYNFYDINEVRDIRLYFTQPNWDQILDSLYVEGQEERMLASVVIEGERFDNVGVRYKGFSSVSVDRKKNPFNIKLDYVSDQSFYGQTKIKLSNVIQDPSFVRETLSYEIARKYMPASRANFANVYVNDTFWGVYTNVEPVNKRFLRDRFSSSENAFFKCNPEHLELNGENCNLSNSPGQDSVLYYSLYDQKSDAGWRELMELIHTLNNNADSIENVLNVNQTLWMHAFNYVVINFDSYIGYAQNYYLYKDATGLFNPILWDMNQSFASYRLTDASDYFRGFTINEAKIMDPLAHLNSFSVHPRPLIRKLLENDTFKRQYLAHIRTIVEENILNGEFYQRAIAMQSTIDAYVERDNNAFYGYENFLLNLDETVSDLVDYPGINDLMVARGDYLMAYEGIMGAPVIETPTSSISGDTVWVHEEVRDAERVFMYYRNNMVQPFIRLEMFDDGMHKDEQPGDGIYGVALVWEGSDLDYYVYAENDSAGRFMPERAAHEFYSIQGNRGLVINELMAVNSSTILDESGDSDDWVELFNNTRNDIELTGYYLSDDAGNPTKWQFPDVTIGAGDFLLVWLDDEEDEGQLHATFKLSSEGEYLMLSDLEGKVMDEVRFSTQTSDASFGRYTNGTGSFVYMEPSPNKINTGESLINVISEPKLDFVLYPNPTNGLVKLLFNQKLN